MSLKNVPVFFLFFRFMWLWSMAFSVVEAGGGSGDAGAGSAGGGAAGSSGAAGGGAGGSGADADGVGGDQSKASPPPVTDIRTFLDEKGNFINPAWAGKGNESLAKKFTSLEALAGSYANLERMLHNQAKVAVPNENSNQAEWDAFYAKVGRPQQANDYKVEVPEALKAVGVDDKVIGEFKNFAHGIGLTAAQVEKLGAWHFGNVSKEMETQQAAIEQSKAMAVDGLKKEWGSAYSDNLQAAHRAAIAVGGDELVNHPLANDPAFIKAMAKVGAMIGEKGAPVRGQPGSSGGHDPKAEIDAIFRDKNDPYHKGDAKRVAYVQMLYQKAYPSG